MRKRNIFIIAAIVVLIPAVAFGWWLLSPLFLSNTVDEEFPFAASAEIPADMTMAQVEIVMETMAKMDQPRVDEPMPTSKGDVPGMLKDVPGMSKEEVEPEVPVELEVPVEVEPSEEFREMVEEIVQEAIDEPEEVVQEAPVALASGSFRDADSFHRGAGSATIYRLPDGTHILRFEDFTVTNGPDLRVLLAEPGDPMSRDELQAGGYTHLAKLKGNVGNQNYEIPAEIDLSQQNSVIIYCMPFRVIFSVAPLEKMG